MADDVVDSSLPGAESERIGVRTGRSVLLPADRAVRIVARLKGERDMLPRCLEWTRGHAIEQAHLDYICISASHPITRPLRRFVLNGTSKS